MPPTRIVDVLAEVFRTHGFDTTSPAHPEDPTGRTHRIDLLAEKDGLDVIVATLQSGEPLQVDKVADHHALQKTLGARYSLIATAHGVTDEAHHHAQECGVIVWDADRLARAIGRAVLMEVTGAQDPPVADLLALNPLATIPTESGATAPEVSPATTFGQNRPHDGALPTPEVSQAAAMNDPLPFSDLMQTDAAPTNPVPAETAPSSVHPGPHRESGRGWDLEINDPPPERARPNTLTSMQKPPILQAPGARAGMPAPRPSDPHTFTPQQGILLAPSVAKETAAQTARTKIFTIEDTRLRYHPKQVYRWQVEAFVEGQVKTHLLSGLCLVDLATKKLEVPGRWETPRHLREGTFDVPVDNKPVRMDVQDARALVMEHVAQETARETTMQDNDSAGDYALTVKRRVRVQQEDIQIEDQGLHWCPVWWLGGGNGEIEVDGLNGDVREERLQSVPSNTMYL